MSEARIETWKDVPNYEGLYQASTMGRIRSSNGVILEVTSDERNRPYVANVGVLQNVIAETFIGDRPKKYDTCHNDGNHLNNKLSNLRYDTKSENRIDIYRYGNKTGKGLFTLLEILFIREIYLTTNHTITSLSKIFNTSTGNISDIVKRKTFSWLNDDGTIKESTTAITYNSIIIDLAKARANLPADNTILLNDSILNYITVIDRNIDAERRISEQV